jgi:hypothetical protein
MMAHRKEETGMGRNARAICAAVAACGWIGAANAGPVTEAAEDGARLTVPETGCVLVNNIWDRKVTPPGYVQSVGYETAGGRALPGWRWSNPGKSAIVLAMPEIVCGDKPWDAPQALRPGFPFRAGAKAPFVRFDIDLKAAGTYNMAFSLWGVSQLPAVQKTISLEIMVWNVAHGQAPAGEKIGAVETAGTMFDLYLKKNQEMVTGPDPFTWPLVQFVARKPLLKGEIDFRPFLDELLKRQILTRGHYLTSVELGNEVTEGTGEVRLKRFEVGLR